MKSRKIYILQEEKMAFRLCPKCHLHYIKDDEAMCSFCKTAIKNNKTIKTKKAFAAKLTNSQLNGERFDLNYDGYRRYLIKRGYVVMTDKGTVSTVYSYEYALTCIAEVEYKSFGEMLRDVDELVREYGSNGTKSDMGQNGHGTWISALNRLKEFRDYVKFYMK